MTDPALPRVLAAPRRVLIALLPPPETSAGGIILPTAAGASTRWGVCPTGIALEVGSQVPDIKPGDKLLLYPYLNPTPFDDRIPAWQWAEWRTKWALPDGIKILSLCAVMPEIPRMRDGKKRRGFGPPGEILAAVSD